MEKTIHKKRMKHPYFLQTENALPVMNGADVEVDKPDEGVLVHGVDVGQICNAEEQHGRVLCHRPVRLPRLCDLQLRLLCNLHINSRGQTTASNSLDTLHILQKYHYLITFPK